MAWTPIPGVKIHQAEGLRSSPVLLGVAQKRSSMVAHPGSSQTGRVPLLFDGARAGPMGNFPVVPVEGDLQHQFVSSTHWPTVIPADSKGRSQGAELCLWAQSPLPHWMRFWPPVAFLGKVPWFASIIASTHIPLFQAGIVPP
jgi:hypothetical protein